MKKYVVVLVTMLLSIGCTNPQGATDVLEIQGFKNVRITGYNLFDCAKDDFYHTGFEATAPDGRTVYGTVCEGLIFKSSTVRISGIKR